MLRLSPFLFYTLSIAAAFSGTAVNHVLAAALSSVPTKSAFHKLPYKFLRHLIIEQNKIPYLKINAKYYINYQHFLNYMDKLN